jgi:hypothetical protein
MTARGGSRRKAPTGPIPGRGVRRRVQCRVDSVQPVTYPLLQERCRRAVDGGGDGP